MALTILEASKLNPGEVERNSIIEEFARNSDILRALPFENIAGNALKYNREEALPGVGFRGVNEAFSESVGVLNPITESLVIAGGDLDVDRFILQTMGQNQRSVQEGMKLKALAHRWTKTFIKGDSSVEPREFDGLQRRIPTGSSQLIDAGATSGGDALSLFKLDTLISRVPGATHLIMNTAMSLRLTQASRNQAVMGNVDFTINNLGQRVQTYNGLEILLAEEDEQGVPILPFTEANPGGGAAASTSIYVVRMGDGALVGIQNDGISVRDIGELETKPVLRTRIEWYAGLAIFDGKAAARLRGVKDAALTA
jgi:Major capsid protein GP7